MIGRFKENGEHDGEKGSEENGECDWEVLCKSEEKKDSQESFEEVVLHACLPLPGFVCPLFCLPIACLAQFVNLSVCHRPLITCSSPLTPELSPPVLFPSHLWLNMV